mgnify:CR=1 FL=1
MEGLSGSEKCAENASGTTRIQRYADEIGHVKLKHLRVYGFVHCDISRYEEYSMIELIDEFCSEVPCFFDSYGHLHSLFTNRFNECNQMMIRLRADFLEYPSGPVQAKIAVIIHDYFCNLPWLNL